LRAQGKREDRRRGKMELRRRRGRPPPQTGREKLGREGRARGWGWGEGGRGRRPPSRRN
jgi:hypothetical protein